MLACLDTWMFYSAVDLHSAGAVFVALAFQQQGHYQDFGFLEILKDGRARLLCATIELAANRWGNAHDRGSTPFIAVPGSQRNVSHC